MRLSLQKEDKARAFDSHCQAARRKDIVAMFGTDPAGSAGDSPLNADWITTPIGLMVAVADSHALQILEFIERPALATEVRTLRAATGCVIKMAPCDMIERVKSALAAYFSGVDLRPDVRLASVGTPFQKQVWHALRGIVPGQTESYSSLARKLGRPDAVRAVARANGANRFAILVPCHRLLGADGALTGYGGGLWRKDWLLQHEKRMTHVNDDARASLSPLIHDLFDGMFHGEGQVGNADV